MLEIIGTSLEDAIIIEKYGGSQIELISAFAEGGLTPSYGLVKKVLNRVNIPINVMIRPHSKSFNYTSYDLDVMREDAKTISSLGIKTVVIGILDVNGLPDLKALEYVLEDTNLNITFHRAFDESKSLIESLEILKTYPRVKTILSSGGKGKAIDNLKNLEKIISNRGNINILIGSGLSLNNLGFFRYLENNNFHFGTSVRKGYYNNEIDPEELLRIREKYENF